VGQDSALALGLASFGFLAGVTGTRLLPDTSKPLPCGRGPAWARWDLLQGYFGQPMLPTACHGTFLEAAQVEDGREDLSPPRVNSFVGAISRNTIGSPNVTSKSYTLLNRKPQKTA
jgi:hypothetical protein